MRVFEMRNADGGNNAIVIAEDDISAIEKYQEKYGYGPELMRDLTANDEMVLFADREDCKCN